MKFKIDFDFADKGIYRDHHERYQHLNGMIFETRTASECLAQLEEITKLIERNVPADKLWPTDTKLKVFTFLLDENNNLTNSTVWDLANEEFLENLDLCSL